jgi:hypothetical protein
VWASPSHLAQSGVVTLVVFVHELKIIIVGIKLDSTDENSKMATTTT